jgi:alcohol dehydrogenase class IV
MLTTRSTPLTDDLALSGLARVKDALKAFETEAPPSEDMLYALMYSACISGIVIAQAGISLPHVLGYNLTDTFGLPHGQTCGYLLPQYMQLHPDKQKVASILSAIGFSDIAQLSKWLDKVLGEKPKATRAQLDAFVADIMTQPLRIATFPENIGEKEIAALYEESVILTHE